MNPYSYTLSTEKTDKMSSTTDNPPATETSENENADNKPANDTTKTAETNNNDKPLKKVKSKKDLKLDQSRFESPGVNFNAKLIGIDDVADARGDKMCQEAMYRLKIAVRQSGQHKQKIIINVSFEGIRIIDVRTHATNHTHPVHRISFISRDITDGRAFGYVYGAGDGKHKFYAIKTEKAAEALVLTLRDLFQVVYEMKKREVEEAKHKIEEPATETATEATEKEEPVYSVPRKRQSEENGTDPTNQVPSNNKPVESEAADLLQMETELETIERRIEQIDTMEELFKELEAPPSTTAKTTSSAGSSSWASDFASLSQAMSQNQTSPTFSVGGAPFSASQHFPTAQTSQSMFSGTGQPFGQPFGAVQPFGAPTSHAAAFGQPAGQFGGFGQPSFGGQANPFQVPSVPPRTGPGFPGPQPNAFPGTPFPAGHQQPAFPGVPGPRPTAAVTPSNDPFGSDPFAGESQFDDSMLTPAKLEGPKQDIQPAKAPQKDAFGDLVDIGGKASNLTPKDLFAELSKTPKKALNELKVDKAASPKPGSPLPQASGSPPHIGNEQASNPSSSFETPIGTTDPFANDPFMSTGPAHTPAQLGMQDDLFRSTVCGEVEEQTSSLPDEYNIPLPQCPPPPLPDNIPEPAHRPPPPPRPSVDCSPLPTHIPPLPPRPKSTSSDSNKSNTSLNSLTESQPVSPLISPPLPLRPYADVNMAIVPRPRPRPRASKSVALPIQQTENTHIDNTCDTQSERLKGQVGKCIEDSMTLGNPSSSESDCDNTGEQKIFSSTKDAYQCNLLQNESQKTHDSHVTGSMPRTSSLVVDPFVSTDPFASEDPFNTSDPFAHGHDPFASDPFASDSFEESSVSPPVKSADSFSTVVKNSSNQGDTDPFSVFDNKLSNENFKFEKTPSRKAKLKVSGQ